MVPVVDGLVEMLAIFSNNYPMVKHSCNNNMRRNFRKGMKKNKNEKTTRMN